MGPQHPSTHGVLWLLLHLSGERILECNPMLGYSRHGQEHIAQNKTYLQFLPYPGRMDYLSALMFNHAHCLAVERAAGIAVPERAEYIRVICAELNRPQQPPALAGRLSHGPESLHPLPDTASTTGRKSWISLCPSPTAA